MSDRPVPIDILLVEDDPSDVLLTKKSLEHAKLYNTLSVVADGIEALAFLRREGSFANAPRPDLILLDLNMPRMDGRELLQNLKADNDFKRIPVVVLTTSDAEQDVLHSYDLHANCYITKPVSLEQFTRVVNAINDFWLAVVKLPPK
jgi:CheY-like chemotaxis protein